MPRPCKYRILNYKYNDLYFKPRGIPLSKIEEINLTFDELEAIRLADLLGLYHQSAAEMMNLSRQTFDNILIKAHYKIADFLINQKALKIEGGKIIMNERKFLCSDCNHVWTVPYGTRRPDKCPNCQKTNIHRHPDDRGYNRQNMHSLDRRRRRHGCANNQGR